MGFVILGEYFMGLNGNRELWKQPLHVSLKTILSNVGVGSSMLVVLLGMSQNYYVEKFVNSRVSKESKNNPEVSQRKLECQS